MPYTQMYVLYIYYIKAVKVACLKNQASLHHVDPTEGSNICDS